MTQLLLNGMWTLTRLSTGSQWDMNIPGDITSSLLHHQEIKDPYLRDYELEVQWIGREDWTISTQFDLPAHMCCAPHLFLELESVDTIATIFLNNKTLGTCSNMFLRYRFDITNRVSQSNNCLVIRIESPEKEAFRLAQSLPYSIPHMLYPIQSMGRNLLRKAQCHGGWDWGPSLMVSGIYNNVLIGATQGERIESIHIDMIPNENRWSLTVHIDIFSSIQKETTIITRCCDVQASKKVMLQPGFQESIIQMEIADVSKWWPNGYGEQPLYLFQVYTDSDTIEKYIGFRTIEVLHQEDEIGIPMTFIVNDVPIFCKGANWIPQDALPGKITSSTTKELLTDARDAHMNMIRVWGGGVYESEDFYSYCDQLGLLVWQDCMFSCSLYPSDPWFLELVQKEITYQVKRLKDHPSLALWCGNNENIGALTWFEESRLHRDRYIVDYDRLNEGVVGKTIKSLDPNRQWWSSSPSAGEGDYSDCWHNDTKGDMHYWSVWHEGKPFASYREVIPRFCSEFGFQSFPSLELIKTYIAQNNQGKIDESELNISSPMMEHHQRNERGNSIILTTMARYFRVPFSFSHQIYLSQVQQALAITTAVEFWRTKQPVCMGALYWQLNDNWPVASWSSIAYGGKWKALHYAACRFYHPHILTLYEEDESLLCYGVNDSFTPINGVLHLTMISFDGTVTPLLELSCTIEAQKAILLTSIKRIWRKEERSSFLIRATFYPFNDISPIEASLLLSPPKQCNLLHPTITTTWIYEGEDIVAIEVQTDVPALWVYLDIPYWKGRFTQNFFHLFPQNNLTIPIEKAPLSDMESRDLSITHLRATY